MKITGRTILLISPEPWDHVFVSKHHYAINLAERGNKVFFLNPPGKHCYCSKTNHEGVYSVCYTGFITGMRFFPGFVSRWMIKYQFEKIEKQCGVTFDVIWSFDNSVFYDLRALPKQVLKISHIVDVNQNFQLAKAARTADFCFCVTDLILEKLTAHNKNSHKIRHGFSEPREIRPVSLPGDNKTKVIYTGNLLIPYIHWELISKIVANSPDADFIFIGPGYATLPVCKELSERNNCFFLGKVDADLLGSYYEKADILLLCYKSDLYPEQLANSHKLMEYLGSGKVIVATCVKEFLHHKDIIQMTEHDEQLPALMLETLSNLVRYNHPLLVGRRKAFARENTYAKQIERIESIIAAKTDWSTE